MNERRPDPDALLSRVTQAAARERRGRLKVFFGAAPGVGKTYAMLQAARAKKAEGVDVVVGYVEAHDRPETTALLHGLETIAPLKVTRAGATRREFDLPAALLRKPALLLVDELAHTNTPDLTHPKRYLDVEDLLNAGIDVYTTVNVQHLESMSDIVAQITGAPVRETIPDRLIEQADEVTLIDLPPEDLLQRLREGKVYLAEQAVQATRHFFRKGNLLALRELALRATADRVDNDVRDYRENYAIDKPWPVQERVLVCIGAGELGEKLVRAGKRAATRAKGDWIAVYVETPDRLRLPAREREAVLRNLRLAQQLGAEIVTLTAGKTFAEEVLELAHARNVTSILVGKPRRSGWQRWLLGSIVDALVEGSGSIDVHVLGDETLDGRSASSTTPTASQFDVDAAEGRHEPGKPRWRGYVAAGVIVVACAALCWLVSKWFAPTNLAMVFLLGVVLTATRYGRGPSMVCALTSVAVFDFFFVPPVLSLQFGDTQYLLSALVLLIVGLVISTLAAGLRLQLRVATHRERRTAALYRMTRAMAMADTLAELGDQAVIHISEVFDAQAVVLSRSGEAALDALGNDASQDKLQTLDVSVAQWVLAQGQLAGLGTDTLAGSEAIYLPLRGALRTVGVLVVRPTRRRRLFVPEHLHLLEAFANQIAVAVERDQLAELARQSALATQEERLRNSLLSSISHDMRTPLAVIAGSASSLLETQATLPDADRRQLLETINTEAQHMTRVVNNLLDMTRLEGLPAQLDRQWYAPEELVGAALDRVRNLLAGRNIEVSLAPEVSALHVDGVLFEKLLINLLENAGKYTPPHARIAIALSRRGDDVELRVSDNGPGIPAGAQDKLFEKFYRASAEGAIGGAGLGLTICRAVAQAHGGRIQARNRVEGGAEFTVTLPFELPPDAAAS